MGLLISGEGLRACMYACMRRKVVEGSDRFNIVYFFEPNTLFTASKT